MKSPEGRYALKAKFQAQNFNLTQIFRRSDYSGHKILERVYMKNKNFDLYEFFRTDRNRDFYNIDGLTDVCLTTDIDWAPDYANEFVFDVVASHGYEITAFATHDSPLLRRPPAHVEIGLHPDNTRPDPARGVRDKISALKDLYPEAVGLRCHRNFFGQNIADFADRSGLRYDVSNILWNQPFCLSHIDYNGMVRFSYMWEDGIHCDQKVPFDISEINLDSPGLKILNVHPILIYLNAPNDDYRREVTKRYSDLASAPKGEIDSDVFKGYGIASFWKDLLAHLKSRGVRVHKLAHLADVKLGHRAPKNG